MKKLLFFFTLLTLLGLSGAVKAQETLTVYDDNTTTNEYVPIYGYFADSKSKCEFIIPSEKISAMSGSVISAMKFYLDHSDNGTYYSTINATFEVFVKEVEATTLSGFVGNSGATTVFNGTITIGLGESDLEIDIPFSSDYIYGGGNLLVGFYQTTATGYNHTYWTGETQTTNTAWGGYATSASARQFLPKTTFTYEFVTTPTITLPASASVITGFTTELTATLMNVTGTPTITYSSDNESVATVSGTGTSATVTGVSAGTATITATMTYNATEYTATCAITVEDLSYCTPAPTSVDGSGITNVTFGTGENIVNNNTHPSSNPYYGDYSTLIGAVNAGVESTVSITFNTCSGSCYNYGTIIWVDLDNSYSFEDEEIVFAGQSASESYPSGEHTLNATFTIPATQALGDYRMRIGAADSYFDDYISSGYSDHDPCYSGSYTIFEDYTLRVIEAPSCLTPTTLSLTRDGNQITATWNGTATDYNININGTMTNNVTSPYVFNAELSTIYTVKVQANCAGNETSEWTNTQSITTPACWSGSTIEYTLNDSYGDGWDDASITVVEGCNVVATLTVASGYSNSGTFELCGDYCEFIYNKGTCCDGEHSWTFTEGGSSLFAGYGNSYMSDGEVLYTIGTQSCPKPTDLDYVIPGARNVDLSWTENGTAEAWQICVNDDMDNLVDVIADELNAGVYTLGNLEPETDYTVKVRAICNANDSSCWSEEIYFITDVACPAPSNPTVGTPGPNQVELTWTKTGTETAWQLRVNGDMDHLINLTETYVTIENTTVTYTLTGLEASTNYTVVVRANCGGEDGTSEWISFDNFTTAASCPTPVLESTGITSITGHTANVAWTGFTQNDSYVVHYRVKEHINGFAEEFEGTSLPTGWNRSNTALSDNVLNGTTTINSSYNGGWNNSSTGLGEYNWKMNIYSTNKYWLIAPSIALGNNFILNFDAAITAYNSSNAPSASNVPDANSRFVVLITTDDMATWTILREWNNTGSADVLNDISNTGNNFSIDLSSYAGETVRIAFYGGQTASGPDCDLHIDNVVCGVTVPAGTEQTKNVAAATSTTIDNLDPETPYDVYVTGHCTTGDVTTGPSATQTFTTTIACPTPVLADIDPNTITTTTATLTWTGSAASNFTVAYKAAGETEYTEVGSTGSPFTFADGTLTHSTVYTVKVKAVCGGSDGESEWSNEKTFVTECDARAANGYTEKFDSYTAGTGVLPVCWKRINDGSNTSYNHYPEIISSSNYNSNSTPNALQFYTYGSSSTTTISDQYAVLPEMTDLAGMRITLQVKGNNTSSSFKVGTMSDNTDASTFTEIVNTDNPAISTSYQQFTFDVPSSVTDSYVAIMLPKPTSTSSVANGVYIDDISIDVAPTCFKPTSATVDNESVTTTGATISWTPDTRNADGETYIILDADDNEVTNDITYNENTATLTGLTESTPYTFKVATNCANNTEHVDTLPVTFTTLANCQAVTNLNYSDLTATGVTLSWTDPNGDGNTYIIKEGDNELDGTTTPAVTVNGTTATITGLTAQTNYTFSVSVTCTTGTSDAVTINVTTPCEAITTFPISYGFETSEGFPSNASTPTSNQLGNCWRNQATVQNGTYSTRVWGTSTSYKHDGSQALVLPDKGNSSNFAKTMLVFPAMDFSSENGYKVSFWIYRNASGSNPEGFKVYASNTDTIDASAVELGHYSRNYNIAYPKIESTSGWYQYDIYIPQATITGNVYLIFEGQSYYGNATYVDDITIEEAPSCYPVGTLAAATNITAVSADLSWTLVDNNQNAWKIEYATDENFTDVQTKDADDNDGFTLNGLTPETHYWVRVKADCGNNDFGEVSNTINFTTPIACAAPTALTLDGATTSSLTVSWTENGGATSWTVCYKAEGEENFLCNQTVDEIPYTIEGLNEGTNYTVKVTTNCSNGYPSHELTNVFQTEASCPAPTNLAVTENSETAHGATITWDGNSENDSYTVEYAEGSLSGVVTLLNEGFEGGSMPTGWSRTGSYWNVGSGTGYSYDYSGSATDDYNATCYINTGSSTSDMLITPTMDLSSYENATISFNYLNRAWGSDINQFHVYYRVNGGEWQQLYENLAAQSSWTTTPISIVLQGLAANYQIGFKCTTGSGSTAYGYGMGIDDVVVTGEYTPSYSWNELATNATSPYVINTLDPETQYVVRMKGMCGTIPSPYSNIVGFTTGIACQAPTALTVGTPSHEEVELSWTENGSATNWVVAYKADGDENLTELNVTENPYTLDNLAENTIYTVKVKADCGSEGFSNTWSNEETFTTLEACGAPTALTMGTVNTHDASFSWTAGNGNNSWDVYVKKHTETDYPTTPNATVNTTSATIDELDANNTYDVKIVPDCDGNKKLEIANAFITNYQNLTLPYSTDFSDESRDNEWRMVNNASHVDNWYIGNAAGNPARSMYISQDDGLTNTYRGTSANSVSFAYVAFNNFEAAKQYTVNFDWLCNGEGSVDYMRAWIVPDNVTLTAGSSLPSGAGPTSDPTDWISVDGKNKMNQKDGWQHQTAYVTIPTDGSYKLVFMWREDYSVAHDPAGTIDNVSIAESDKYTVTVNVSKDAENNVLGSYTSDPTTLTDIYDNTLVKLTAGEAIYGYEFTNWTNNHDEILSSNVYCNFTIHSDTTLIANYDSLSYTITAEMVAQQETENWGTVSGTSTVKFNLPVTLTATPETGYKFVNWTNSLNEVVSTEAEFTVNAYRDSTFTAHFDTLDHSITVVADPTEGGTVTGAGTYKHFKTATLTATANEGYTFANWTNNGTEVSTDASYAFTVTEDSDFVANFSLNSYKLTINYLYENGTVAASQYTETVNYNAAYSVESPDITGYTADQLTVAGTMGAADVTVDVTYDTNSYTLTINYNYVNGTEAATTHTETVKYSVDYSVTSPVLTGYTADQLVVEGTMGAADVTVDVTYDTNSYTLTINYLYENGTEAATTHTETVKYSVDYSVTSPVLTGYTADQLVVEGTMGAADVTVDVTYDTNSYTLTINYKYENGTEAATTHTETVKYGVAYSVNSPAITGYTADQLVVEGTMGTADVTVNVTYDTNSYTLTINYKYENGTEAATTHTETVKYGVGYSVTSPVLTGYTADQLVVEGTMDAVDVTVDVTYDTNSYTLTINYLYENGTEAATTHTETVKYGVAYSVNSPAITGYTADLTTVAGTMGAADVTVDVTYDTNSYTLTINYKYENGTEAATTHTETVKYGVAYSVNSPAITGYTADLTTVAGTMGAADVTVNVTYNINSYEITATTNPTAGGTISGAGTYNYNTTAILIATANTGYTFVNWTKNGAEVSINPSYTITVTEEAAYVANFELNSYEITATATPTEGGSVSGAGTYNHFESVTLTATPTTGYTFINWTKNGTLVSSSATYTFTVTEGGNYVATFSQNSYEIAASANPTAGGTVTGAGSYAHGQTANMVATPATGYHFVNWTKNSTEVSTNATYSFTVEGPGTLVANFELNSYEITATVNPTAGGTVNGAGTYNHFATVTLSATPASGYAFVNWTKNGTPISTDATYTFTATEATALVANFELMSYNITATANPTDGGSVNGAGSYVYNTAANLTATANPGYAFVNWTKNGTAVSTNPSYSFTVTEDAALVANFSQNSYTITATANPTAGGTVSGAGDYNYGASATLTANPAEGYTFVKWTKNGTQVSTSSTYTFTVEEAGEYVANFTLNNYTINATANPTAGGTVSGAGNYDYGTNATLTATANTGYIFTNWTKNGTEVSTNASYTFTVTEAANYVANFTLNSYTISAVADPTEGGTVTGAGTYNHFGSATLTATPAAGYAFINWTKNGTVVSTTATYTFTVEAAGDYVAHFSQNSYEITATANPTAGGTIEGAGNYVHGSTATLTATTATGYTFTSWTKNGTVVSNDASYSFTVTEAAAYVANFTLNSYAVTVAADPTEGGTVSGAGSFNHGTSTTLTAIPATGYAFVNWTKNGLVVSTTATYTFNVTEAGAYVAHFSQNTYAISAVVTPEGSGSVTGTGNYTHGATATLTATANEGYNFTNWTDGTTVVSTNATYSFTVDGDRSLKANFTLKSYTIATTANPVDGGVVTGAGTYNHGATATLTATANTGYTFTNWTKDNEVVATSATYTVTVTEAATYVANFELNSYAVTATANPTEGGTTTGTGTYNHGATATLTATANTGYTFANWTKNGTEVSTTASLSVTVTEAADYVANFTLNSYAISATANPTEGGTVTGANTYNYGETATLTATANEGYTFTNWTKNGTEVTTTATYSFTVEEAGAYVANFTLNSYELTVAANPAAGGTVSGAGTYNHGATANLTATANTGYYFVNWTKNGSVVSSSTSCSVTVTEAAEYVANFTLNSYEVTVSANPTAGGTVSGEGSYNHGATVTLTATPADNYTFTNWTKNGAEVSTNASYTFTATESGAYVANFTLMGVVATPTFSVASGIYYEAQSVNINCSTNGATIHYTTDGSTPTELSTVFNPNTPIVTTDNGTVTIKAIAMKESMITSEVASAVYRIVPKYNVVVAANEHGTITANPTSDTTGATINLTAVAAEGYSFNDAWTVTNATTGNPIEVVNNQFTMPASNVNVSATFTLNSYTVSATANPTEGGTVGGAGTYNHNETATLTATANEGYYFVSWTKNSTVASTSTAYSITVTEDNDYVANFATSSYNVTLHPNGGTINSGNVTFYTYTEGATLPTDVTLTGNSFGGWFDNANLGGTAVTAIAATETGNKEFWAKWTVNSYALTINYKYADGSQAAPTHTENVNYNTAYDVASPVITGYTPSLTTVSGTMGTEAVTVNVVYSINSYDLTINYQYADGSEAAPTHSETLNYNVAYSVNSPVITGYTADQTTVSGTMGTEAVTVNVTYNINSYDLTINYKYANGTQAAPAHTENINYNVGYSVTSPAITGYTPSQAIVSGTMGTANVTVDVIYNINSYALTINYKYADGTTAATTHSENVNYNAAYSVTSPVITGYTANQTTVSGTMGTEPVTVEVTYNINSYNLTINYKYANGTQAAPTHSESVNYNVGYSVTSPDITGYTPSQAIVSGTMGTANVTVDVIYNINSYALTINYKYADGSQAAPTYTQNINYNASYSVTSPAITGYTASQATVSGTMGTEPVTVEVTYNINSYNLTINYKYANGTEAAPAHSESINYNVAYSVTSPVITGYTASQATVSGTMGTANVTVDVTYSINSYNLVINYKYADGTQAAPTHSESVNYNVAYAVTSPTLNGYVANRTAVAGNMPDNNVTVNVTYYQVATSIVDATNCGSNGNGSITVTAPTGNFEYSINGTNYQSSNVFNGLNANDYTLYIRPTSEEYNYTGTWTVASNITMPTVNAAANDSVFCLNNSIQLNGNGSSIGGEYTYAWEGPAGYSSNYKNPSIFDASNGNMSGTYTLTVTNTNTQCASSKSLNIYVNDVTNPDYVFTISGFNAVGNISLGESSTTANILTPTINHFLDGIVEDYSANNVTLSNDAPAEYTATGDYNVTWTATDACGNTATCTIVVTITNSVCPMVQDVDGNIYSTVAVGSTCWMNSNLKTTHYADGREITNIYRYYYQAFPNVEENVSIYGLLYDWYDALDVTRPTRLVRVQGICPDGWYLPNEDDFEQLNTIPTNDLRSTSYWLFNQGTNASGYDLRPGGMYNHNTERYEELHGNAYLWSATEINSTEAHCHMADCHCYLIYDLINSKLNAYSVRCVKGE